MGVEPERGQRPVGVEVGLLEHVVHPVAVAAEELVRQAAEAVVVAADDLGERAAITGEHPLDQVGVRRAGRGP